MGQASACRFKLSSGRPPLLFLVLLLLSASCGGSPRVPAVTPVAPIDGSLTVKASEWKFEPPRIVLQRGQRVTITFENDGSTLHDLRIADLDATGVTSEGSGLSADDGELFVAADKGKSGTLVFTPTQTGEFDFYCTIPRHRDLGMKGFVTVE